MNLVISQPLGRLAQHLTEMLSADLGTRAEAGDCKNLDSAWTDFAISATRPKADIEIWSLFDIFHRAIAAAHGR